MFCTKCGAEIQEGAKFCVHCGNPVAGGGYTPETTPAAGNPMVNGTADNPASVPAGGNPAANGATDNPAAVPVMRNPVINRTWNGSGVKPDRRKLYIVGALALIAVVIFALTSLFKGPKGGSDSPEEAFEAYMNGYWEHDFDRMLEAYPAFYIKGHGGEDRLKDTIGRNYEVQVADYVAAGYIFSYKATGHTILDKEKIEEVERGINNEIDSKASFSAVATVDYQIIMDYGDVHKTSSMSSGYAVKYKGKWYYFNVG